MKMTLRQISFRRVLTQGLIFLIIILLSGCDSERNRLIMGLFQTETPNSADADRDPGFNAIPNAGIGSNTFRIYLIRDFGS